MTNAASTTTGDIIDNRHERLVDHINEILKYSDLARFAVGYFFLSGLESIAERLDGVKELRLLIGNTSNHRTIEQIAEGYRRLELIQEAAAAQEFTKRAELVRRAQETAEHIRETVELMDQTDETQRLVATLARLIEEGKLKVRVYTRGRLHAKAYIFDYKASAASMTRAWLSSAPRTSPSPASPTTPS